MLILCFREVIRLTLYLPCWTEQAQTLHEHVRMFRSNRGHPHHQQRQDFPQEPRHNRLEVETACALPELLAVMTALLHRHTGRI